jgi:hypothetical protein
VVQGFEWHNGPIPNKETAKAFLPSVSRPVCHTSTSYIFTIDNFRHGGLFPEGAEIQNTISLAIIFLGSDRETIFEVETTAKKMSTENSTAWLVYDMEQSTTNLFTNQSMYHTIYTISTDSFISRIKLLPSTEDPLLQLQGKLV